MNFNLKEKVVVITGGAGAIGSSLAKSFAREGCKIVIISRTQSKIDQTITLLKEVTPDVLGISCDVMNKEELIETRKTILDTFGKIDILINAAGGNVPGGSQSPDQNIFDLTIEHIDKVMDLNMKGTIYPSLIFGKTMAETGSGSIITISSMAAYSSVSRVMGYSVGKKGINSFTQWMACELARKFGDKVRVNAIAPGFFIGDQNRDLLLNADGTLTERSQKVIAKTPMGRFGKLDELSGATLFLCSEAASFITGVVLPIDGGFSSFSGV